MQWWLVNFILFFLLLTSATTDSIQNDKVESITTTLYNDNYYVDGNNNNNNNIAGFNLDVLEINNSKSSMACQDTDLELVCDNDEYPKLISGYFGRYSLVVCNPYFKNFQKDCANKNIAKIIEKICNKNSKCKISATEDLFGNPCSHNTHVLEVNYICTKKEKSTTIKSTPSTTTIVTTKSTPITIPITTTSKQFFILDFKNVTTLDDMIKDNLNNKSIFNIDNIKSIIDFVKQKTIDESKEKSSKLIINTANLLLNKSDTWKELDKKERSKSATLLMDSIEKEIFDVEKNTAVNSIIDDIQINTNHIVAELKFNKDLKNELKFPTNEKLNTKESVYLKLKEPKSDQKFLFMVYNDVNELLSNTIEKKHVINDDMNELINTNIISFKINNDNDISYLKENPIELTFINLNNNNNNNNNNKYKPICSYWHYDNKTYEGEWRSDGCSVKTNNDTHTVCLCKHLTHFAVLMDVRGVFQEFENNHTSILSILTIILSILSIICIILTLLIFRHLKRFKNSRSVSKDLYRVTINLCCCLLISLVVFLLGVFIQKHFKYKLYCSIIAIMSQYFFLCSFFWMFLEGVQLYLMLIKIFDHHLPISIFCFIGYGAPFAIVTSSVIINYYMLDDNGYGTAAHCWLSSYKNFNLSFIIPISVILLVNFIFLIVVMCRLHVNSLSTRKTYLNHSNKQEKCLKTLFISGCLITTLLGLPWIIGYFIIDNEESIIFSYLFTILNSSQGIFIFIFNCISSKYIRNDLLRYLCKNKFLISASNSKTNSSSSSSNSTSKVNDKQFRLKNNISNLSSSIIKVEKNSNFLNRFLTCFKNNKNIYELKNDSSNSNNQNDQHQRLNKISAPHDMQIIEDEPHAKLLIYEPIQNDMVYNQIKNPLHYHPYHRENLPKRSSSHASSNSSNSNRTHMTYVSPLIPTPQGYLITPTQTTLPLYYRPVQNYKQSTSYTYYLVPRTCFNTPQDTIKSTGLKYIIPSHSVHDGAFIQNYANQNLPPPPPPTSTKQHNKQKQVINIPINNNVTKSSSTANAEEHNYSLIESELQTDIQYYCDQPICSYAMEEDDFNINSYTEVPNQYDELDDMKILPSSSSSSSSLSLSMSLNKPPTNQHQHQQQLNKNKITIPKTASVLSYNNNNNNKS